MIPLWVDHNIKWFGGQQWEHNLLFYNVCFVDVDSKLVMVAVGMYQHFII